jgi:hypothetical protein
MSDRDDRLSSLLVALGTERGPEVDLVPGVLDRIRSAEQPVAQGKKGSPLRRPHRRRWWVLVVVVPALALTACVAIPGVRNALLDLIHLHGVVVRQGPVPLPSPTSPGTSSPSPTPGPGQIGSRTTLRAAELSTGGRLLVPARLGPPDQVWQSVGIINLIYEGATANEPRYVITEVTSANRPLLEKIISLQSVVTRVNINGDHAFWIVGLQELIYLDPDGSDHHIATQLAANSLLWEHHGVTVRMETRGSLSAALVVARSMR